MYLENSNVNLENSNRIMALFMGIKPQVLFHSATRPPGKQPTVTNVRSLYVSSIGGDTILTRVGHRIICFR